MKCWSMGFVNFYAKNEVFFYYDLQKMPHNVLIFNVFLPPITINSCLINFKKNEPEKTIS